MQMNNEREKVKNKVKSIILILFEYSTAIFVLILMIILAFDIKISNIHIDNEIDDTFEFYLTVFFTLYSTLFIVFTFLFTPIINDLKNYKLNQRNRSIRIYYKAIERQLYKFIKKNINNKLEIKEFLHNNGIRIDEINEEYESLQKNIKQFKKFVNKDDFIKVLETKDMSFLQSYKEGHNNKEPTFIQYTKYKLLIFKRKQKELKDTIKLEIKKHKKDIIKSAFQEGIKIIKEDDEIKQIQKKHIDLKSLQIEKEFIYLKNKYIFLFVCFFISSLIFIFNVILLCLGKFNGGVLLFGSLFVSLNIFYLFLRMIVIIFNRIINTEIENYCDEC